MAPLSTALPIAAIMSTLNTDYNKILLGEKSMGKVGVCGGRKGTKISSSIVERQQISKTEKSTTNHIKPTT